MVIGDMPADVPNAIVYRKGDRLYLMDSGAGPTIRASILKVLRTPGFTPLTSPFRSSRPFPAPTEG
jgi:hypothetical protein